MEQYQAQVGAALRPAFGPDVPSHVTAAACNVCSAWIGSGVARDLGDLRRVYQLLVSSLDKIKPKNSQLYNESALTLEKLSILKGWAEVYTVSMKNEILLQEVNSPVSAEEASNEFEEEEDDFGDFKTTTGQIEASSTTGKSNLTSLVQSELLSLSKHWLAALKDHALLSLPPEFKSQLPFDGGAFYTNDTIEAARPHYKSTWAPILKASAIWLTYGQGFDDVQAGKSDSDVEGSANLGIGPANAATNRNPEDINKDRFFLLFGICIEALANTRSADMNKDEVTYCLQSLKALLFHQRTRKHVFAQSETLLIETCNVLHRTVLTRDHSSIQILAVEVLQLVLQAARESLDFAKRQKLQKELELPANQETKYIPELALLGEGGESGKIEVGKSVVFATLEVGLCVLVRHYPELSQRAANLNSLMAIQAKSRLKGRHMTEEQCQLISRTLRCLAILPSLCSPLGALKVLPSILWLITGVLKEASWKKTNEESIVLASNPQTSAALQSLREVASCPHTTDPISKNRWSELMQSALLRVLDMAKTAPGDEDDHKLDEVSLLLAIAVFILHGSPETVSSPNIQYPAINAFTQGLQSNNYYVRHRCVLTLQSIFAHNDRAVALPYVQGLAPRIVEYLLDSESREIKSEIELLLVVESLNMVEILVKLVEEEEEKKSQLLSFLIPILISQLLQPENMKESSQFKIKLHENALAKLTQVGQKHSAEFKSILAAYPELKGKLESAALANQARLQNERLKHGGDGVGGHQRKVQDHKPSIQLKMDFSNFGVAGQK